MDGWMDGWMDGLMDGWMDDVSMGRAQRLPRSKPILPREGFLVSNLQRLGKHRVMLFGCLVCWLLAWFVCLAALFLRWVVGWWALRWWMDAWMDAALPHVPEASGSVSGGSRRSG